MTAMREQLTELDGARTAPLYTIPEAARLARVSPGTVRSWLFGAETGESLFQAQPALMVSFLQLIEVVVAAAFRRAERVSLARLKNAHHNAKREMGLDYPFAFEQLEVVGGHVVRILHAKQPGANHQAIDEPSSWTLPDPVACVGRQIGYEGELAARWYPVGDEIPIVIDPRVTAGVPTIQDRGVSVHAIRKRYLAGQDMAFIARDFRLDVNVVECAVRFGEQVEA